MGKASSFMYDNVVMEDHSKEPTPTPAGLDGPAFDASAPGVLEPARLVKFIKNILGPRHADAPSVDIASLRRVVVVLAEHLAALELQQQQTTRKAKQ
jgi:hypothetical protein